MSFLSSPLGLEFCRAFVGKNCFLQTCKSNVNKVWLGENWADEAWSNKHEHIEIQTFMIQISRRNR